MILPARRLRQAPQTQPPSRRSARGFTLIELMIAVAIVGILARIALPAYLDSVKRGKITEAFNTLSTFSLAMQQYYQDNRTYATACSTTNTTALAAQPPATTNFTFTCPSQNLTTTTFLAKATGNAGTAADGFIFSIDQNGTRYTVQVPPGWPSPPSGTNCWIASKSGNCFQ